jgi:hypothetical protein
MDNQTEKRIAALEKEILALRLAVTRLVTSDYLVASLSMGLHSGETDKSRRALDELADNSNTVTSELSEVFTHG